MASSITVADEIEALKTTAKAAQTEAVMAIAFHETWKPTAYDKELHRRMGFSYATQAFQIVRLALRREMLLALIRIWDKNKQGQSLQITAVREKLRDKAVFNAIVDHWAGSASDLWTKDGMRKDLEPKRARIIELIQKYLEGGSGFSVVEGLRTLRHERLAHYQLEETKAEAATADTTDDEIEAFYEDTLEIVRLLLSLVWGDTFSLSGDVAGVYRHYAKFFWENVSGEQAEGPPANYRRMS
ncbi:hypothetical protein C9I57_25425 [Trinickia symbiotica]|uniref:HEPN AbiU2-like domain-containing protein n=1 Tax=Trinickia symbiotica TaxID=863227 RepID=A0A2T3XMZ6_9BURK|nr:hypothetical protein [Trinickia symbiotica]PTB17870.1 hypothetical protein C9I57_25425 [Trinickia symbiotica]